MGKTRKYNKRGPSVLYAFACEAMPFKDPNWDSSKGLFAECNWYTWDELIKLIEERRKQKI